MNINIKVLADVSLEKYQKLTEVAMTGFATEVMAALKIDRPRPPTPGSMRFVSEKQRRFVMAMIKQGRIQVPYVRASTKSFGSANLQASYRINKTGQDVQLVSDAPYADYVIGDQQAQIHQGRWKTSRQAVEEVISTGTLDAIVQKAIAELEM
jgi:hypothetical protein